MQADGEKLLQAARREGVVVSLPGRWPQRGRATDRFWTCFGEEMPRPVAGLAMGMRGLLPRWL